MKTWLKGFLTAFCAILGGALGITMVIFLLMIAVSSSEMSKPNIKLKSLPNAQGLIRESSKKVPSILHLSLEGIIGNGLLKEDRLELIFSYILNDIDLKNNISGVLLDINSPGGDVAETHRIYQLICDMKQRLNVPVYVFANGVCASGGYYIACGADKIFGSTTSLVGSIGVVSWPPFFNVTDLLERIGVNATTIKAGNHKDDMNPFREWTENETASRQEMVDFFYDVFVDIVVKNRPLITNDLLKNVYGAKVLNVYKAQEAGFVDEVVESPRDVIAKLVKEKGIEDNYIVLGLAENGLWKKMLKERYSSKNSINLFTQFLGSSVNIEKNMFPCSYRYIS
ncbi:Uncharacterized protein CLAVI_000607 [Candidatus Clavichlamydia salmonicola]|uniref:S49 family peptidase n=1 Tax=Candidatus Clavichlamydia salmonicola TaxID=469812 RepID=UPI001890F6B7|nr:S49 family peptidase [Candidatus Clavichlamydia salmonicola]MBF5050983.1 Uncharacterized protein [Candidatus Clavichlamydia salmonicola]